ncbi:hypothetical protein DXB22_09385 [Clostridiaceae bacterium OM02-2AC]|nr:hypothetical protein DXB22_09385 [Clostridiaceae bacterium OM02-2AC]
MRKRVSILMILFMIVCMSMSSIHAEDKDQKKDTDEEYYEEVQSNLPWKQEVNGGMYGYMLGVIKKPEPVHPEDPDQPQEPDKPGDDDIIIVVPTEPINPVKPGTGNEASKKDPSSNAGKVTNKQSETNEDKYTEAYKQQELERVGYYWNDRTGELTISRTLLSRAKADRQDIYLYVEAQQQYRIHIVYSDIKSTEKDITIDLGECRHLEKIQKIAGKDVLWILQYEKEPIGMRVHIAVKVPESWKDKYLYHYIYEDGKFVLKKMMLKADEDGYVEVVLTPKTDQVITDKPIIQTDFWDWVKGLLGQNEKVDHTYAAVAIGSFTIALGGLSYVFLKRRWGKKHDSQDSEK